MKFTPSPPTYAQSQTNPTACNCNGVATVSVICGEAPYTYQWSNAVTVSNTTLTTSSISGLCPGVYQVTVTSNCNYTYTSIYNLQCALPIELVSFNGSCDGSDSKLEWSTASETNNDYFTIEKSKDALIFEKVADVDGSGNSATLKTYEFNDLDAYEGISYYRLKQTDFDQNFKYSKLISIKCEVRNFILDIYPNPSPGSLNISNTEYTFIMIVDALNRLVLNQELSPNSLIHLDMKNLNDGFYNLIFINTNTNKRELRKLIKYSN
jgi:hypothetical protein